MNRFRFGTNVIAITILTMAFATLAQAQATRTWVSGVGDDVNPCSRTAPCKTYAGAISKTAKDGEISTLDPGGFGTVTITKSITINGGGAGQGYGSILASGGVTGVIINITDALDIRKAVRLDGLNINGASTGLDGVRMLAGLALHIEDTIIDGFTDDGVEVAITANSVELALRDVTIRSCVGDGVRINSSGAGFVLASMDRIQVVNSGNGVNAESNSRAHIRNSQFASMNTNGILCNIATAEVNVDQSIITNSPDGVRNNGGMTRVSRSVITGNTNGLNNIAGTLKRFNNNMIDGNSNNTVGIITPINEG